VDPVPDRLIFRSSGSAENRTRVLSFIPQLVISYHGFLVYGIVFYADGFQGLVK
jgi:hypothetical protein